MSSGSDESDLIPDDASPCFPHVAVADDPACLVTVMLEATTSVATTPYLLNTLGVMGTGWTLDGVGLDVSVGQVDGLGHCVEWKRLSVSRNR